MNRALRALLLALVACAFALNIATAAIVIRINGTWHMALNEEEQALMVERLETLETENARLIGEAAARFKAECNLI